MGQTTRLVCQVGLASQEDAESMQGISNTRGNQQRSPGWLCCLTVLQREGSQYEMQKEDTGKTAASALMIKIRG